MTPCLPSPKKRRSAMMDFGVDSVRRRLLMIPDSPAPVEPVVAAPLPQVAALLPPVSNPDPAAASSLPKVSAPDPTAASLLPQVSPPDPAAASRLPKVSMPEPTAKEPPAATAATAQHPPVVEHTTALCTVTCGTPLCRLSTSWANARPVTHSLQCFHLAAMPPCRNQRRGSKLSCLPRQFPCPCRANLQHQRLSNLKQLHWQHRRHSANLRANLHLQLQQHRHRANLQQRRHQANPRQLQWCLWPAPGSRGSPVARSLSGALPCESGPEQRPTSVGSCKTCATDEPPP